MRMRLVLAAVLTVLGLAWLPGLAQTTTPQAGDELAGAPRISQADFKKAFDAGTVLVIDVRDAQAYASGHIPGAISIPLDQIAAHAQELKGEKRPIVTYCS